MRFQCVARALSTTAHACLVMLAAADVAAAQARVSRQVAVVVQDSGDAVIDGAVVVMSRGAVERRAVTGTDGIARFNDLDEGEWIVEVRKEGFAIAAEPVTVGEPSQTITIRLERPALSETVTVEARAGALGTTTTSATRLELSLKELPATLNVVTQEVMQERGANTAMDAIEIAGGVLTTTGLGGQLPGYQTRGFSGNSIMNDGIRQNSSVQSSRPQDSFTMGRVEVLKGPASLLAGEGGTAGTVNYVSKSPKGKLGFDGLLSAGSFGAWRTGIGVTGPLGRTVMARFDVSQSGGGGWAKPSHTDLRTITSSVWWTPDRRLTVKAQGKYTADDIQAYYSTPCIDGEPDPRMRYINYNLADAFSRAHHSFARVDEIFTLDNGWQFRNSTFAATQRLDYRNMESYSYNPATGLVDVRSYFLIWRHDLLVGNQFDARRTVDIAGRSVTFIAGGELQRNRMQRARNPPEASSVRYSVDPFNPAPVFDPKLEYMRNPDVQVTNTTFYAEALARLSSRWTSVLGVRTEQISVDYALVALGPLTENKTLTPTTGRAGLVYALTNDVNLYGSYSTALGHRDRRAQPRRPRSERDDTGAGVPAAAAARDAARARPAHCWSVCAAGEAADRGARQRRLTGLARRCIEDRRERGVVWFFTFCHVANGKLTRSVPHGGSGAAAISRLQAGLREYAGASVKARLESQR